MTTLIWRAPDGRIVAPGTIRRVWAAVSHCPQVSVRELSAHLNLSIGHADEALQILRAAGYIACAHRSHHARQVLIPFAFIPDEPPPDDGPEQGSDVDGIPLGGK